MRTRPLIQIFRRPIGQSSAQPNIRVLPSMGIIRRPVSRPSIRAARLPRYYTRPNWTVRSVTPSTTRGVIHAPRSRTPYIPRSQYLAGARPPAPNTNTPGSPNKGTPLVTVFGDEFPHQRTHGRWRCYSGTHWDSFVMGGCKLSFGEMGSFSESAISKRCSARKTRQLAAGVTGGFALYSSQRKIPFVGQHALFAVARRLKSIRGWAHHTRRREVFLGGLQRDSLPVSAAHPSRCPC